MFGMSVPSIPGAGDSKGSGGGGDDFDAMLKEVDELSAKLDESEKKLKGMLAAAAPKVDIKLPKLSRSLFGGSPEPDGEQVPLLSEQSDQASRAGAQAKAGAKKKLAEAQAKAAAAQKEAEAAKAEMEAKAKEAIAGQASAVKQYGAQGMAAVTSLLVAGGVGYMKLGATIGPMIAAASAVILNFLGLAMAWNSKAMGIFKIVNGVFDKMKGKVLKVLDTVDDMIGAPLNKLEEGIDDMCEEQKPTLGMMKKMETGIKQVDKDFDLPEPADMKKPLDGCDTMIDKFVDDAKKTISDKIDEMVQSNIASRVATDESSFKTYIVVIPLAIVLIVNLAVAALQVMATAPPASTSTTTASPQSDSRLLRGSNATHKEHGHASAKDDASPLNEFLQSDDLMVYLKPVLVQIGLALLQLVLASIASQGPRICDAVNGAIENFQKKINERINDRIKEAVDKVFTVAFGQVKEKADEFFPKFKDSMGKLKKALDAAKKMGAMAGAVGGLAKGFGS